eukprot:m.107283 g.107283  ORF g.107283 m.107283 type:complete len:165 (-) comp19037_c2_seq3:75-569(-)
MHNMACFPLFSRQRNTSVASRYRPHSLCMMALRFAFQHEAEVSEFLSQAPDSMDEGLLADIKRILLYAWDKLKSCTVRVWDLLKPIFTKLTGCCVSLAASLQRACCAFLSGTTFTGLMWMLVATALIVACVKLMPKELSHTRPVLESMFRRVTTDFLDELYGNP